MLKGVVYNFQGLFDDYEVKVSWKEFFKPKQLQNQSFKNQLIKLAPWLLVPYIINNQEKLMVSNSQLAITYYPGLIWEKSQPIINLLQDIAEPLAYGMLLWGLIKIIAQQRSQGMEIIKVALWGFVGVMLAPMGFDIIKSIGRG